MTISMTSIKSEQWYKVGKVGFWLLISSALASLTAWLANNAEWLTTMPAYNIILYTITQIFQDEESQASAATQLPLTASAPPRLNIPVQTPDDKDANNSISETLGA